MESSEYKNQIFELTNQMNDVQLKASKTEEELSLQNYQQDIDLMKKKLVALNAALQDKLDADIFDQELNGLKSILYKSETPADEKPQVPTTVVNVTTPPLASSFISTKDLNRMKDLFEKFP